MTHNFEVTPAMLELLENISDHLRNSDKSLPDIAAASGVSLRTLYYMKDQSFNTTLGATMLVLDTLGLKLVIRPK